MRITHNVHVYNRILYSLQFEGEEKHAWERFYKDWGNPQFVEEFLNYYRLDLCRSKYRNQKVEDLITNTVRNVRFMQNTFFEVNLMITNNCKKDIYEQK